MKDNGSRHQTSDLSRLPYVPRILLCTFCGTVFVFLLFPVLVVIPLSLSSTRYLEFPPRGFSLQWFYNYFGRDDWTGATILSVKVALLTTGVSLVLGTLAAFGITRTRIPRKELITAFLLSPMIVPSILLGIAVYFFYSRLGLVGTTASFVLTYTVLAIPFVVVSVSAALNGVDQSLERAAMSLGANRIWTFLKVTLPLIRPGILTAAVFAFLTAFDELVIAIFISGPYARTLPKRMWDGIRLEIDPTVAAVSAIIIAVSCGSFLVVELAEATSRSARDNPSTDR